MRAESRLTNVGIYSENRHHQNDKYDGKLLAWLIPILQMLRYYFACYVTSSNGGQTGSKQSPLPRVQLLHCL